MVPILEVSYGRRLGVFKPLLKLCCILPGNKAQLFIKSPIFEKAFVSFPSFSRSVIAGLHLLEGALVSVVAVLSKKHRFACPCSGNESNLPGVTLGNGKVQVAISTWQAMGLCVLGALTAAGLLCSGVLSLDKLSFEVLSWPLLTTS